jgi:hypothetical protein
VPWFHNRGVEIELHPFLTWHWSDPLNRLCLPPVHLEWINVSNFPTTRVPSFYAHMHVITNWSLKLLEPSWPVSACYGIALPLPYSYIVEPCSVQMTIWSIYVSCWVTRASDTESEYVTLTAFLLHHWLHQRVSALHYRCTNSLIETSLAL